jgi:DNA-binding transcriptional ArsR family regulator
VSFAVLAEPARRDILDLLREGERPVGDLVERLRLSQPAVSKHLRVLRDAGLVDVRADAQRRLYSLRVDGLVEIDEWLAPYRMLWNRSLDKLERHLTARTASARTEEEEHR